MPKRKGTRREWTVGRNRHTKQEPHPLSGNVRVELDPLGGLPSLVSLTRLTNDPHSVRSFPAREDLAQILAIDPILTLRALRIATTPLLSDKPLAVVSPDSILSRLGTGALARMVGAGAPRVQDVGPLFRLWLHSIASAVAARSLAQTDKSRGRVDPDEAYTCALLHDLPHWSHLTSRSNLSTRSAWGPLEWSKVWRLPRAVQVSWLAAHCGTTDTKTHHDLVRLVVAGEALAILAGYAHPGSGSRVEFELVQQLEGRNLERLVQQVREGVSAALQDAELDIANLELAPSPDCIRAPGLAELPGFEQGVVKLQELSSSERYRPVLTTLVAGICHYLGFDRSFYLQWIGKGKTALIRTKYDRSAVPVGSRLVEPSPIEVELMGKVVGLSTPKMLRREENFRFRLLDHLGSDAMLVVPVCGSGKTHGLLLLDRGYTNLPILPSEHTRALALAGIGGLTLLALDLKRQGQRSRKEAQMDSLTGLLNRRAALNQLSTELQRVRRRQQPMTVLMLDLDHFKDMNDTYGHLTGDRVLARVGSVLKATLRGSDVACRYGGEEFLVIQFDTTIEEASIVAARIYKAVEEAGQELNIPITISVGLTELRAEDTVESLIQRADKALYASKHRGRNRFSVDSQ